MTNKNIACEESLKNFGLHPDAVEDIKSVSSEKLKIILNNTSCKINLPTKHDETQH
ncbi:hypothetical protein EDF88_4573 [Buttiauxella sp. BIGb0552]|nr:hypothetical protein EDF88_4573 [Buttiauxella sp. BIGb0552]